MAEDLGKLVNPCVLAEIWQARPKPVDVQPVELGNVLAALEGLMDDDHKQQGADLRSYYQASLMEVSAALARAEDGFVTTPKRLGGVLRQVGLTLWRRADGYFLAWNSTQFDILRRLIGADTYIDR